VENIRRAASLEHIAFTARLRGNFSTAEKLYQDALYVLNDSANNEFPLRLFAALADVVEAQGRDATALSRYLRI